MIKIKESIKYTINDKESFSINDFVTVTMDNGEVIKGKVSEVYDDSMEVSSEYFDETEIEFEYISRIQVGE